MATSGLKKETEALQSALSSYCRSGIAEDISLSKPEHLPHYRRLVFNVVFDILSHAYPLTRQFLDDRWKAFVEAFFAQHKCQEYQVWKLPRELINYVQAEGSDVLKVHPFLTDLLNLEWLEIEVYNEKDLEIPNFDLNIRSNLDHIIFNPHHRILFLDYPVHRKQLENIESHKGEYAVIIFRDLKELNVKFVEVNPNLGRIISSLTNNDQSLKLTLERLEMSMNSGGTQVEEQLLDLLKTMQEKGFVLGSSIA